ncbi:Endonuclease/exonuclease/phosphatase [Globomyces pollinis-pini]|nr:Endonuclease/exonuclease/phosphatase [Globomyces pollinis-pini]
MKTLIPYIFDGPFGRFTNAFSSWKPFDTNLINTKTWSQLTIITYNVYFHGSGFVRFPFVLELIKSHSPDIVAIQECTHNFLELLMNDKDIKEHFVLSHTTSKLWNTWYGVVLLVKRDLNVKQMGTLEYQNTRMGRECLFVEIDINGKRFALATSHFESGFTDKDKRKEQWEIATTFLKNFDLKVLCGDFNVQTDDTEESLFLGNLGWEDTWVSGHKIGQAAAGGFTFGKFNLENNDGVMK